MRSLDFVRKELQLSTLLDLKESVAECADQNCGFCRNLNKTRFCGRNPYPGGEPRYILCCGYVIFVLLCFYAFDK